MNAAPQIPAKAARKDRRLVLGAACIIAITGFIAYRNSFSVPFLFDDRAQVLDNPTIRHLSNIGAVLRPPPEAGVGGRPLLNLSFALDYAVGGLGVWGYHAVNLAIHILAGLTLFGILRRTLRPNPDRGTGLAFAIALIWTVHPLQTEAVTYVAERAESLMGLFYLLTVYCFVRSVENEGRVGVLPGRERTERPSCVPPGGTSAGEQAGPCFLGWLSVLACLFGILAKETVATAPVIVLLYDRTFVSGTFRESFRRHGRIYLGYAACWLLLAGLVPDLEKRGVGFDVGGSWWTYALNETRVIIRYLGLAVWPHPLVFDHGMGIPRPGLALAPYVLATGVLVAATGWALFRPVEARPGVRMLGFAGAWFLVILAPTSSFVAVAGQPMAEHRMYLPLAAVITVIACVADYLGRKARRAAPGAAIGIVVAVALACVFLTVSRNRVYQSEVSLWQDTVAGAPDNARAENALGMALFNEGQGSAAMEHYRRAIAMAPEFPGAYQNLGAALAAAGRNDEAVAACAAALRLRPSSAEAHRNLGVALWKGRRLAEAEAAFREAVRLRGDDAEALAGLGAALSAEGSPGDAIEPLGRALRLDPELADVRLNLANALLATHRFAEGAAQLGEVIRTNPADASARDNLAIAYFSLGRFPEAEAQLRAATGLAPGRADFHYNLGALLWRMNRLPEARAEFERALELKPDYAEAREQLTRLQSGEAK
jgi:tetratricopeptide (TPR) repeat protein